MAVPTFTPEEISVIDKNFGFIVFDWAKNLINHILTMAREGGVEVVYMNTSETLSINAPVSNDMKAEYFYDKLPPALGFKKEKSDLRGRGLETLWAYRFGGADSDIVTSKMINALIKMAGGQFTLEQLPSKYQGAFLGIIGRKPYYTQDDVGRVLEILKQRQGNKGKLGSKFYYDWDSRKNSSQLFDRQKTETVVLQRLSEDVFEKYSSNPILVKFMSFLISQYKHFDASDVMGFALVLRHSPKIWVINEIQTDCINKYMDIRNKYYKKDKSEGKKGIDWNTLKDMLQTGNRSKWITKLEGNDPLKRQIMQDPGIIQQLPDDTQDIDKWISDQQQEMGGALERHRQLRQFLGATNFCKRVFRA